MKRVLAKTWNGNEAGRLWDAVWYVDDDGNFGREVYAPGVYTHGSSIFTSDVGEFWKRYREEESEFHGKVLQSWPPTSV